MNLKTLFASALLSAAVLVASCNKSDDNDDNKSQEEDKPEVVLHDVDYALTVKCGGAISKLAYTEDGATGVVSVSFNDEDVAKPLVMTITGENVSGTLTLKSVDGTFAGTLTVPEDAPDTLVLTASIEIPAVDGDDNDNSTVSLVDLMRKCGHRYSAKFKYKSGDAIALTDSKAYFEFRMSPLQHWMKINNKKYNVNSDGTVWLAVDAKTPVVTTFYRQTYNTVKGGSFHVIDRGDFVDFGITDILWADKNVGADKYEDYGDYYDWDDAQKCVSLPLELPCGGEEGDPDNDFWTLWSVTESHFGDYNGVAGIYIFLRGCTDIEKDPFIFLPAGGTMLGGTRTSEGYCLYWSCKEFDKDQAYRLFVREGWSSTASYIYKSSVGGMSVRPVRRSNNQDDEDKYQQEVKPLVAFFPTGYDASKVVAWYTSKNERKSEEWALYLFDDNTYVVTQHLVKDEERVLYYVGDFTFAGEADAEYNNFKIIATVGYSNAEVEFKDGACTFVDHDFRREAGAVPEATEFTKSNINVKPIYFPVTRSVDKVVAWYKQSGTTDNNFMVLYMFQDKTFSVCNCQIKNGVQCGSETANGSFEVPGGTEVDYRNMDVMVKAHSGGIDYTIPVSFKDGKGTILRITMEIQELSLLYEMLGVNVN